MQVNLKLAFLNYVSSMLAWLLMSKNKEEMELPLKWILIIKSWEFKR